MTFDTALEIASRIWGDKEYSKYTMNAELAVEIAHLLLLEANKQDCKNVPLYDYLPR
jgi:hypothetical protein